jgi:alkanesulfonate monooxygenase SsuD/methylene tetrahydromethanopterin reductase-like flavin-dependent oxidoreductase (luciferase family)
VEEPLSAMGLAFALRFDLRNPDFAGTALADRYDAALEMAEWADGLGCASIVLSEHHASPDSYLPSPITMAAAMAARTKDVRFTIAALIAPFYEPVRLAEDLLVLDHLSRGRVDLVLAAGYVRQEFELFGVPSRERGARLTEAVHVLRAAFHGQPFEHHGRTIQLTPGPYREGGLPITLGGSSVAAARRAARIADAFIPSMPEVWDAYREEVVALGKPDPGPAAMGLETRTVAVAADPEEGWRKMAPYYRHEMEAYGAWQAQEGIASPYQPVADDDELRSCGRYDVLAPAAFVEEIRAQPFPFTILHPLCGGMPIDLAWESLRLFERAVLPAFSD